MQESNTRVERRGAMASVLAFVTLVAIYGWVGYNSPGYDDEFTNINLVEHHGLFDLIGVVNTTDVHPPGSYVINWILFRAFHDWHLVRLVTALLSASALFLFYRAATRSMGAFERLLGYVCICLSPALLLWTAGLRWYAYFAPVLLLTWLCLRDDIGRYRYYLSLWLGIVLLFHLGYAAIIVAPALLAYAIGRRWDTVRQDLPLLAGGGLIAALLCLPQFWYFVHYHLPSSHTQTGTLAASARGLVFHLFDGQGSYPTSLGGGAVIAANAMASILWLRRPKAVAAPLLVFFAGSALLLTIAGLTAKVRNLTILSAHQGLLTAKISAATVSWMPRITLLGLFAVGNICGVVNVATHSNTTKGSWNTPYVEVLRAVGQEASAWSCARTVAISSDPVLRYYLAKMNFVVAEQRGATDVDWSSLTGRDCVFALKTFRGATSKRDYADLFARFDGLRAQRMAVDRFGRDEFVAFQRRFDADVPDYYVTALFYQGVINPAALGNRAD